MTSSDRNLQTAIRRFEVAERGRVEYVGLDWPEFHEFEDAFFSYDNECSNALIPESRRLELERLRTARFTLAKFPISPAHSVLGLGDFDEPGPVDNSDPIEAARRRCISAVLKIRDSIHPATSIQNLFNSSDFSKLSNHDRIVLVAPNKLHSAIRECFNSFDLPFTIHSQSELKHHGVWDVAIYFGAQYASYPGTPLDVRKKKVAWMYSAPAAFRTVQVMWSGDFALPDFTTWAEYPLSLATESGPTRFRVDMSPLPPPPPPPVPPPSSPDAVPGFIVDLAGGYRVMLAKEYGPKAHLIEADDHSVRYEPESSDRLTVGDTLLLRVDRTAREFVTSAAREKLGPKKYDAASSARDTFKQSVKALADANFADCEKRLTDSGIANAAYYLRVCGEPEYISPNEFARYRVIAQALGLTASEAEFTLFKAMRASHRRAGVKARELIEERLRASRGWEDETRETGFCEMSLEDLGTILIAAVTQITPSAVSLSSLGRVQQNGKYLD